jgi:hypothetical protein
MPDCFSMLRSVPTGTSRFGSGTVTRPFLDRMLELRMAALARYFHPAVGFSEA